MHLWPSLRIRESFKLAYLQNLEWNLHRMKQQQKHQSQQKLVDVSEGGDAVDSEAQRGGGALILCRELLLILSCCYCCFCCGACVDDEEAN
ncbi:uncharacterized protein LOC127798064 [Diospyros lotus]|uniref:uncharacterized protein LOC127798064 n=1 Tax=Diospyros lotus TaxID=55363 RepID=UPI00224E1BBC|nr:uncharacterized protein LOC127798064 [Diospyros lotus]